MKTKFDLELLENFILFLLVIPIYVGLADAFVYTITGHTITNMEWSWDRVALVFLFFAIRITAVISRNKARAKREGAIKDVN
jgi:surface polysaccharide O-acyltransferase-like enzyme